MNFVMFLRYVFLQIQDGGWDKSVDGFEGSAPHPPELSIVGWGVVIGVVTITGIMVYLRRKKASSAKSG